MKQMADNLQRCHKNEVHVHQYKTGSKATCGWPIGSFSFSNVKLQ